MPCATLYPEGWNSIYLKKGGRGNGILCRGISLKLKKDCFPTNNNWDGRKVQYISVEDVEYMTCEYWRDDKNEEDQKTFRIKPEYFRVNPLVSMWGGRKINIGGIKMKQLWC